MSHLLHLCVRRTLCLPDNCLISFDSFYKAKVVISSVAPLSAAGLFAVLLEPSIMRDPNECLNPRLERVKKPPTRKVIESRAFAA